MRGKLSFGGATLQHDTVKIECVSCGSIITGNYCANCGEKKLTLHDLELSHYLEEIFEGFTHFDGKFFGRSKRYSLSPDCYQRTIVME